MTSKLLAALSIVLTAGPSASAALDPVDRGQHGLPAAAVRNESEGWRTAREAVFGLDASTDAARAEAARAVAAAPGGCTLETPASDLSTSTACLDCHRRLGNASSHPIEIDYQWAQAQSRGALRSLDAVVKRGVFLPQGIIQCTSCHDARSPWANHIALPPGAVATPAVDARKPETFENRPSWRAAQRTGAAPLPHGTAVTAAPLCAVCHTLAD